MYKLTDFKEKIVITDTSVECPVKCCDITVERQQKVFRRLDKFKCPIHNIYISPTTFEYESELDNLLWIDKNDKALFNEIKKVKRESRISRDNSEDAVTWNVFRYLERNSLLNNFLSLISGDLHNSIELILWSYSQKKNSGWPLLIKARSEFGENIKRGSEPDIIILTDKTLFFIEAKLFSNNKTSGTCDELLKHLNNPKKYVTGEDNLFSNIFKSKYCSIVVDQKYELMRFWLLGSWIAKKLQLNFHLINLVLTNKELLIEKDFGKHINVDSNNIFSRITWEDIYNMIIKSSKTDSETELVLDYFRNKSAGFNSSGELKKAFITKK